jgi:hypothetical protein
MRRALLLSVCCLFVFPGSAGAVELVNADGSVAQPYQLWADLSDVPTVPGSVAVGNDLSVCGSDPQIHGCAEQDGAAIHLAGPRCNAAGPRAFRICRFVTMHELGHLFDLQMPEWKRIRFRAIWGRGVGPDFGWDENLGLGGTLREYFADTYATCSMHDQFIDIPGRWLPSLSLRQHNRICHLIRIPNA